MKKRNVIKKLIIGFVLTIAYIEIAPAQTPHLPTKHNKIHYSGTVMLDNSSKEELYIAARKWFVRTYKSAKDVIQMDDKEAGIIMGVATMPTFRRCFFRLHDSGSIEYLISIEVKDGGYDYEVSRFTHTIHGNCDNMRSRSNASGRKYKRSFVHYMEQLDSNTLKIIRDLKYTMGLK